MNSERMATADEPRSSTLVYRFFRFLFRMANRLLFRMELVGVENVPLTGGCILASNHASHLDPPLVGCAIKRVLNFMARDTLMPTRFARWLLLQLHCVPIDRTGEDVGGLRRALRAVKAGAGLVLFPEGTRTLDGRLQPPKPGVGFLVAKAGAPVVPVCVHGSFSAFPKGARWIRPGKITVYYGKPITPEEIAGYGKGRDAYERLGELIMARIAALMPPSSETAAHRAP